MREQIIPRARPDDDTLGADKSEPPIEQAEKVPFAKIEELVPGINLEGLKEEKPGYYSAKLTYPTNTLGMDTPYSAGFLGKGKERREKIKELQKFVKDRVVVDLGAGRYGAVYEMSCLAEARGYIGIELYRPHQLYHTLTHLSAEHGNNKVPACVVGEDMRAFLKRLPDNSVCIVSFGIDGDILGDMSDADHKELREQVSRVIHNNSAQISGEESVITGDSLHEYTSYEEKNRPKYKEVLDYLIRTKTPQKS